MLVIVDYCLGGGVTVALLCVVLKRMTINKFTNSLCNCNTLRDINMILELLLEITMYPKLLPTAAKTVFVVYYVTVM